MAVMEVQFPSGFTADLDTLPSLEVSENVKKVETKDGDTVVVVYFESIGRKELCPTLDAFRTHKVAMQKPAAVTLYDYYDNCKLSPFSISVIQIQFNCKFHFCRSPSRPSILSDASDFAVRHLRGQRLR